MNTAIQSLLVKKCNVFRVRYLLLMQSLLIYRYVMKTCAKHKYWQIIMTWSNGNIFRVTDILCGIHRSPMNSYHKGQWRSALMFSFICAWINGWVHNRDFGELRRHRAHYDVIAMLYVSNVYTSTQGRRTNHRQHIRHKSKVNYPLTQCLIYCDFNFDLYRIRYFLRWIPTRAAAALQYTIHENYMVISTCVELFIKDIIMLSQGPDLH